MKKTIIFGITLVLFSIFANACSLFDKEEGQQEKEQEEQGVNEKTTIENNKLLQEETDKHSKEIGEIGNSALSNNDPSRCDQIEDQNEKGSCKYNVIIIKALEQKDESLCDEIGHESFVQICKESVSIEKDPNTKPPA